jgi:hypothetical protein
MMFPDQPAVLQLQVEIVDRQQRSVAETTAGDGQQRQPPGVAMTTVRRQHQGSSSSLSSSPCLPDLRNRTNGQTAPFHSWLGNESFGKEQQQQQQRQKAAVAVVCHWHRPAHRRSIQPSGRLPIMIHSQHHHQHRPCRTMKGNIIMTPSVITATANSMDGTNWDFVPKACV